MTYLVTLRSPREARASKGRGGAVEPSFEARPSAERLRMTTAVKAAGTLLSLCALAACTETGTGFVEIKTVPVSSVAQPALYFDSAKLEPVRNGAAVLTRKVGTTKLQTEGAGGQLALLCNVVVKKNRITTITVSVAERPPRCRCSNSTDPASATQRTCIG